MVDGKRPRMIFHTFEELTEYVPGGHDGVVNRLLAGEENGGEGVVSVWHGKLEPGGHSDLHTHPDSLQIYIGVSGVLIVGNADREETLVEMSTTIFPKGALHFIENRSDTEAEVLVISAPGLR